jgi:serine/threonine-protein kinase PknK
MHTLARYRFLRRLGAGAAGGVYLVEDRVLGGPPLALKRVEQASDPAFRDSYAREFAVLASLSVPGVARVHDLGVAPASEEIPAGPFFTRDFVDGQPLSSWARERPLREVVGTFLRVLSTTGELHRSFVLHGDLHPGNVIVDAQGMPYLIDFGLSSRGADVLHGSGTPMYMAPELLAGAGSTMSADIYALGATLWAALTGAPPWSELGERALAAKLNGDPPHLQAEPGSVLRRVLEACAWALAHEPRSRAPSVDELAAKLELALGEPAQPVRPRFAPPRPRGRTATLDQLSLQPFAEAREPGVVVLYGARGMGKSTLLRELKWRLQLAGREVITLHCGELARPPLAQLARQLDTSMVDERELTPLARSELAASLARSLAEQPRVLLVDDLDAASSFTIDVLRAAATEPGAPHVIGSSESLTAPSLAALVDVQALPVSALPAAEMRALIADTLGPIEQSSVERLLAHAEGNPGILLEALDWAWQRGDVSALGELAPGEIAASLAERRVAAVGDDGRALLTLLAVARAPLAESLLMQSFPHYPDARAQLLRHGLAHLAGGALRVEDHGLGEYLRQRGAGAQALASRALEVGVTDPIAAAELALVSAEAGRIREHVPAAVRALRCRGSATHALRLCDAASALGDRSLALEASELCGELGDYTRAAELAEALLAEPDDLLAARARVAAGRAHVAASRLDRAVALLSAMPADSSPALRAQAGRELARAQLRRGEFEQARRTVQQALAVAAADEPARVELLAIEASLASKAGEHAHAEARFADALALARTLGLPRDAALVLGYRAIAHERRGALAAARADYEAALADARLAGDLGQSATHAFNLGNVCFRAGQLESVENHYTLAGRLARRTGRLGTALSADNGLAALHVQLGSFARARLLAEATLAEAERLGSTQAEAHALSILADVDARSGASEAALARYEASAARFAKLGRDHEIAGLWLDAAETLLDRGGISDVSAGAAKVALARELMERHGHDDLRPRLRLLVARARAGHGDLDGAVRELADLERSLDVERDRQMLWQVLAAQANMHLQLGAPLLASRKAREAAELIELLASQVPRNAREAFCAEPRRSAVLELARDGAGDSRRGDERSGRALDDPRFTRLLELIKRLARERDLPRLLERITDAAVDLSGAERGFVLLVDASGQLAPHTVRNSGGAEVDPHVAFSRSIAEAVLIDGEPIVTVNARDDRRLNEFMSVHKLMLKSVACIPISGPSGVLGVLYLEHRLRAGRFQEDDIDLLMTFADQAAIALENARLWTENLRRSEELETKAHELAQAKTEIERILEARTEELEQTRRDLGRARAELAGQSSRHGIVGQSATMRRVFALIERVADSPVPIVVEGESGTGKELVARAIHSSGMRKKEPFVAINCAALPEQLLESELFGHVRGAFTGADRDKKGLFTQAEGGTIFLDEFADMPARMQIDLLRVLQERRIRPLGADADIPVDVRIIAASNRPLKQLVASGRLREDLYYRMSVVEIRLPSLRERPEDIPMLCDHLLARASERSGARPRKLSRAALERIVSHPLPGNVRQLEHLLTSAAMLAEGTLIEPDDLGLERDDEGSPEAAMHLALAIAEGDGLVGPEDVHGFKTRERKRIIEALEKHGWNRAKAATALGMPRRTFYRRLTEFNIL